MQGRRDFNRNNGMRSLPLDKQLEIYYREFRRFFKRSVYGLAETLEPILKPLFAVNRVSAMIRSSIFAAGFMLWLGYAYVTNPPDIAGIDIGVPAGPDAVSMMVFQLRYLYALFLAMVKPLFLPEVFRFVLVITFSFWLSSRVAAIYLADIFDLPNISVAVKFIRQAAFVTFNLRNMNYLVIKEGEIDPEYQKSPISQIGGPGLVRVNLENVAVFEKVDGTPHIIQPTGRVVQIEGFERLRKIIDLRDQFIENEEVQARTKDGIPVSAKGIRYSFSVQRDKTIKNDQELYDDEGLPQPFSYTDEAILKIVYEKPDVDFDQIGGLEIKGEIGRFINRNTLSQFLADSREEDEVTENLPSDPTMPLETKEEGFKNRETINQELITAFKTTTDSTIDLHWVSVGTWVPPPAIPEKHREAWNRRLKSAAQSNPKALKGLLHTARLKELLRLIQDVPINAFGHIASREDNRAEIKRQLMLAYREKIKNAYDIYKENDLQPPVHLVAALKHLQRL